MGGTSPLGLTFSDLQYTTPYTGTNGNMSKRTVVPALVVLSLPFSFSLHTFSLKYSMYEYSYRILFSAIQL